MTTKTKRKKKKTKRSTKGIASASKGAGAIHTINPPKQKSTRPEEVKET